VKETIGRLTNTLKQWLATLKTDFAEIVYSEEASKQWEEGLNAFVDKWNELLDQLGAKVRAADIPQEERNSLSQIISQLKTKTSTLIRRCQTQIALSVVRREMQHTQEFQRIAREFAVVLKTIMPEVQVEVRLFPPQDEELLSRLAIELSGFPVSAHGSGYQSSFVLGARILNAILQIQQQTQRQIKNCVLAIEEPEAHWHPHSQRFLIRGLKNLQQIWADQFHLQVQFIITTHSSHIVSCTDFTDLLIFPAHYGEVRPKRVQKGALDKIAQELEPQDTSRQRKVYSGMRRWMDTLFQKYPDVFFSRCALLVEGRTEEGALPAFALTLGEGKETDFDRHSITVVSTEGAGDIVHAARVLQTFGIKCIAIYDRDKGENRPTDIADKVFVTEWKDFEDEVIHSLAIHKILDAIMQVFGDREVESMLEDIRGHCHSLQEISTFEDLIKLLQGNEVDSNDVQFVLKRARKWLDSRKGFTLGRALAEQVKHEDEIPRVYQQAIRYAVKLATQIG
jgi:predicted ATP-dependent endonuclease of OLD family